MNGLLLLWQVGCACRGHKVVGIRPHVDASCLTRDVAPESLEEETRTVRLHKRVQLSDGSAQGCPLDLVRLKVNQASPCGTCFIWPRTRPLLAEGWSLPRTRNGLFRASSVVLSFFCKENNLSTLAALVLVVAISCIWNA